MFFFISAVLPPPAHRLDYAQGINPGWAETNSSVQHLVLCRPPVFPCTCQKTRFCGTQQDARVDQRYWEAGGQCVRGLKDEKGQQLYGQGSLVPLWRVTSPPRPNRYGRHPNQVFYRRLLFMHSSSSQRPTWDLLMRFLEGLLSLCERVSEKCPSSK